MGWVSGVGQSRDTQAGSLGLGTPGTHGLGLLGTALQGYSGAGSVGIYRGWVSGVGCQETRQRLGEE